MIPMPYVDLSAIHSPARAAVDMIRFLSAIQQVENPNADPRAIGPHGERGLHQIDHGTWIGATGEHWDKAFDPVIERQVAVHHYLDLKWDLLERRVDPTVHRMALAWKMGAAGADLRVPNAAELDYAKRVEALYKAGP